MPDLIRFWIRSNRSKDLARFAIVVDSPPGITRAEISSISLLVFTAHASTPQSLSDWICSRTSPWSASTPIFTITSPAPQDDVELGYLQH